MSNSPRNTRLAAYGVMRVDGALLLVRESERSDAPGTWRLPGGGVTFGEHPVDAVVTEFAEETGFSVAVEGDPVVLSDVVDRGERGELHTVRLCFVVSLLGGELAHEVDGTTDLAKWVDEADVDRLPLQSYVREALAIR